MAPALESAPLVAWCLAVAGIAHILTRGRIFAPLRRWATLGRGEGTELSRFLGCPLCVGFWVGLALEVGGLRVVSPHSLLGGDLSAPFAGALADVAHGALGAFVGRLSADLLEFVQHATYAIGQWGDAQRSRRPPPFDAPPL